MNKLPLEIKFKIISWIFKHDTLVYLENFGYCFKPNLHKHTLFSLVLSNDLIFYDLILNGLYDDNYYWIYNFKFKGNKQTQNNYKDLLFLMVEKNIRDEKYFKGLFRTKKKNFNLIDTKNNTMALHCYITKLYSEQFICNLVNNHELFGFDNISSTKKGSKCLEFCWNKKYDLLLKKILQSKYSTKISEFFANKINTIDFDKFKNDFPNSLPYMYKYVSIDNHIIKSTNIKFYLDITKKYYEKDYEKVLRSSYLYNLALNHIYVVTMYLSSYNNTEISREIFNKIDYYIYSDICTDKYIIIHDKNYDDDILFTCLVKSYEYVIYGTYKDDIIPLIINIIISHYKLKILHKNIDDFKNQIKKIIPEIKKNCEIHQKKNELLLRVIKNGNQEYAKLLLSKINFNKLFTNPNQKSNQNLYSNVNNDAFSSEIIYECLENNLNDLICYLIIKGKVDLFSEKNYYNNHNEVDYSKTFFELLFKFFLQAQYNS